MKKKYRKLTQDETDKAVSKIRKEYDEYIVRFMKTPELKQAFEERYVQALSARMDLETFLHAEMTAILQIIDNEKGKQAEAAERNFVLRRQREHGPKKDHADKVIEKMRKKIEGYPSIHIHPDASFELSRLYGTMNHFEKTYVYDLDKIFKQVYPISHKSPWEALQAKLWTLSNPHSERLPAQLQRYRTMFSAVRKDYFLIGQEEKRCLVEVAYFLHNLRSELKKILNNNSPPADFERKIQQVLDYINKLLLDFRLKDLKP